MIAEFAKIHDIVISFWSYPALAERLGLGFQACD